MNGKVVAQPWQPHSRWLHRGCHLSDHRHMDGAPGQCSHAAPDLGLPAGDDPGRTGAEVVQTVIGP